MLGASAVAGWVAGSGAGIVKQYYLGGYGSRDCPPDQGSLKLVSGSSAIVSQSSKLYLAFQLNITAPQSNLVLAVGPRGSLPGSDNYLPQHRSMTRVSVNYASGESLFPRTHLSDCPHWILRKTVSASPSSQARAAPPTPRRRLHPRQRQPAPQTSTSTPTSFPSICRLSSATKPGEPRTSPCWYARRFSTSNTGGDAAACQKL